MPFYQSQGSIPKKRHTVFKNSNSQIYYEELVSRSGFSSIYTNLYHLKMPTNIKKIGAYKKFLFVKSDSKYTAKHFVTKNIKSSGNSHESRRLLLYNNDLLIYKSHISDSSIEFCRNGHYDELYYVQDGCGELLTNFGLLKYNKGDYIVIPRGVIYQFNIIKKTKVLLIESISPIETPSRYRNKFGQLLEHSPFCERDIKVPVLQNPKEEKGNFVVNVRLMDGVQTYIYENHPFDVVGWDGYYFPWIFNIHDFEPITGSLHQPPPVHQTFQSENFVICSFVSRKYDFHPESIPAPYPHSNVDSDEVIFYSKGDFMSRKGIHDESITLHPMGLPHGPQPGKYEESIGKEFTNELAVMIDTFNPLYVSDNADKIVDKNYPLSWSK